MTDLTGKLISGTYQQLLLINSSTANEGVSTSATYVQTGDGTNTALKVATNKVIVETALRVDGTATITSGLHVSGKVCASSFFGDGSNLTGLTASIGGDISVSSITVAAGVNIGGSLKVVDNVSVSGNIHAVGAVSVGGTLTQTGVATFVSNVTVGGKLVVEGDVSVSGQLDVNENVSVGGTLLVTGTGTLTGKTEFKNDVSVSGRLDVAGSVSVGSVLNVTGIGNFATDVSVSGNMHVVGNVTAALYYGDGSNLTNVVASLGNLPESVSISGYLNVGGAVSITGAATFASTVTVVGAAALKSNVTVGGTLAVAGNTSVGGTIIATGGITFDGSVSVSGTLNVAGNTSIGGTLIQTGAATFSSTVTVVGNAVLASLDVTGVATAATFEPDGDTAAGDNAAIGYTAAEGLILTGQGSTSDITLKNDADGTVFTVPTGTDDVLFPDSAKAMWGAGSDLQVFHDGSNSYVQDTGTGSLFVEGSSVTIRNSGGTEAMASFTPDGAVSLYHNNAIKLATAATGVTMTGEVTATGFTGTLDGVLGGGTAAAASVTTLGATGVISAADGSVSAPSISFSSDTNNGLAYINADNWGLVVGGAWNWYFQAAQNYTNVNLLALNAAGPGLLNEAATSTNPTLVPNRASPTDGIGAATAGNVHIITGGVNRVAIGSVVNLGMAGSAATAALSFNGDFDTGLYHVAANTIGGAAAGAAVWQWSSTGIEAANAAGPSIRNVAATATVPPLNPNKADADTGVGWVSANIGSLVAGGAETLRWASGTTTVTGDFFTSNAQGGGLIDDVASTTVPTILPRRGITNTGLGSSSGFTTFITSGALIATLNSTAFEMANAAGPSILNEAATATNPTLVPNKADPNTGIGWVSADSFNFVTGGGGRLTISDASIVSGVAMSMSTDTGPVMLNEAATATNPTLAPNKADLDTGVGWVSADIGSLVAGGVEALRWQSSGVVSVPAALSFTDNNGPSWGSTWQTGNASSQFVSFYINSVLAGQVNATGVTVGNAAGGSILNEAATSSNPTIIPNKADLDTGIGWVSADIGSLVAGGVSALSWNASADVGIKTAAPLVSLHVQDSALSGSDTWTADVQAVFGRNGNAGIAIYGAAANSAKIKFAKPADYDVGSIGYNFATDVMSFKSATLTAMNITGGAVTKPLQPAFAAYNSATDASVTGAGTFAAVDFDTEVFDQGADFAADTFTAPVAGRYFLQAAIQFTGVTAAADRIVVRLVTSNRTWHKDTNSTNDIPGGPALNMSAVVDMDAGDTALVHGAVFGESSNVVSFSGSANPVTFFSGCLLA
jgi:hypothetical protein